MQSLKSDIDNTYAIFLTGDLSQDESKDSYQLLVKEINKYNTNIYWIPGNHDSITEMENIFGPENLFIRTNRLNTPVWDFIFISTKQHGTDEGYLSDNDLYLLEEQLKIKSFHPIAIVMHHHPAEVNTPLVDKYILKNKDQFWKLINSYSVNLIIFGHVHGDYSFNYNNVNLESSPSTCLQWEKGTTTLELDLRNRI